MICILSLTRHCDLPLWGPAENTGAIKELTAEFPGWY